MKKTLLNLSMLLLFMIVGLGSAWAEVVSGTTYNTVNNKDMPSDWEAQTGSNSSKYAQLIASTHYIKTETFSMSSISSIVLNARTYGGPSSDQAKITVSWYSTDSKNEIVLGTCTPTSTSLSNYTIEVKNSPKGEGYIMIQCKGAGSSKGAGVAAVTINFTIDGGSSKVKHNVIWSVNGETTSEEVAEGDDIKFASPSATEINGKTFVGWVSSEISGKQSTEPSYVTAAKMGTADVTYYAVYAKEQKGEVQEWKKITNKADITSGTYAIITFNSLFYLPNSPATSNAPTVESIHLTNGKIDVTDVMKWKMSFSEAGYMNFESLSSTNSYLWGSDTNEGIRITETSGKRGASKNWEIAETADYGLVLYLPSVSRYLSTYGSQDWRNYSSTSTTNRAANLYKLVSDFTDFCTTVPEVLTITLNPACKDGEFVYSTFSSSLPFYVSGDIEVSEISILDDALYVESYNTGDIVPANTGVMVSAQEGGDYEVEIADAEIAELAESVFGEDNRLRPSGDAGITADKMAAADADCTYFRLTMHNGTQIGYWWGAEDGAAFALAANKAYLAVPNSAEVKSNLWFSGNATSVSIPKVEAENATIYNLAGQRVSATTKGIYIKNGKKLFVK